ncbi:STAS domain-containing protein [Acuticoccus sp. MNP-M23]|uniref:STAS domain-containing protein n=1 Tax=Acuticoccus sp. MNP-M23 TaxID=3072793 RepID=UPI0028169231|nr:STAS domain-containing protein [Acuticoccus sp. MNP-M23]WMS42560.1 STAS domain-containing protein [Acuticoccus sp. MNP-M23]
MPIEVTNQTQRGVAVVKVDGRVDSVTSPEFEAAAIALVGETGTPMVLDLGGVHYISSAGLRVLLKLNKRMRAQSREFALAAMRPDVDDILVLTGFDKLFERYGTVADAVASLSLDTA